MKKLSATRTVLGPVVIVGAQVTLRAGFFSSFGLYRRIPDAHAFWSALALYSGLLSMVAVPALLAWLMLRGRSRFAGLAALLVAAAVIPELSLAAWVALIWFNAFRLTFWAAAAVVSITIFGGAKLGCERAFRRSARDSCVN